MNDTAMGSEDMSQQQLAEACSKAMYQSDQATQALGIELLTVGPGRATLSMRVTRGYAQWSS